MAKTRIVKKRTKTFDRFESNRHIRLDVIISIGNNFILKYREAGEDQEVLIALSEEDSEETWAAPKSVLDQIIKLNIYCPITKKNS